MSRRDTLSTIYTLYEKWAGAYTFACREGCATCCTQSVTMTTLEGELIIAYLSRQRPDLLPLLDTLPGASPAPRTTTNQFAAACLRGEDIAEDPCCWDLSPCIFLRERRCAIYPVRSFMCRSFGSRVRCEEGSEAEIEPLFRSLNTLIMQCIEHLDQGRPWGNMNTILRRIAAKNSERKNQDSRPLPIAQPLPGFLLLPEEEAALQGQIQVLFRLLNEENRATRKP